MVLINDHMDYWRLCAEWCGMGHRPDLGADICFIEECWTAVKRLSAESNNCFSRSLISSISECEYLLL